jgi:hypothetical protein
MNTAHLKSKFDYSYTYKIGGRCCVTNISTVYLDVVSKEELLVNSNVARFVTVEMLRKMINFKTIHDDEQANKMFEQLVTYYTSRSMGDKLSQGILKNLVGTEVGEGQVKLAITNNEYYMRWGEFYLDQLSRSLNQEIKPNFRDTACPFGGKVCENLVDVASDVFDTLPPPEPSLIKNKNSNNYVVPSATHTTRVQSLVAYNSQDTSNPCFVGTCVVKLPEGGAKLVKYLNKGDKVLTLSDPYDIMSTPVEASVVCVLKTIMPGIAPLVTLGTGLKITPWHPVLGNGEWQFHNQIGMVINEPCDAVYSILLDSGHTCMINGIWCIGLGHSYDHGILKHEYFGSSAIVEDMKSLPGWDRGLVVINSTYSIIRDALTTQIISIRGKGKANDTNNDLCDPICATIIGTPVIPYV